MTIVTGPGGGRTRPITTSGVEVRMAGCPRSPRNCAIRREDGTVVVRPYRGLRKFVD
ncbi:hypothetical protein [Actinomadura sp. NBRC 104425]|uniref:hypothetical protein n=1 Tax=Actinomadura sp. NBRC 104425 TaxID=3032204 RepID=UPI002555B7EE|nr:hypothetical protein [Actinomadura sp. NBRC 104425]